MAGATVYSSGGQQQQQQPPPPPKPPRRNPYRDGQSRAAQYYDLYEMIRHPNLARDSRPPDPPPPKKFANKQQMIEHEMDKRFQRSNKTGMLISVVRGLVFVTVWPFMMLFIALPQWIYQQIATAFTQVKLAIQRKIAAVRQFFIRRYRGIVDPFKTLWKKMSDRDKNKQEMDWDLEELGFFAFIAMGLYYGYVGIVRPTIRGIKAGYSAVIAGKRWVGEQPQKMKEAITDRIHRYIQKIAAYPKKLLKKLKSSLLNATVYPLQNKLQQISSRIEAAWNRLTKGLEGIADGIKQTVLRPVETFKKMKNHLVQGIQNKIRQVKQALRNLINRPVFFVKNVVNKCKAYFEAAKDRASKISFKFPFVGRFISLKKRLKGIWESLKRKLQFKGKLSVKLPNFMPAWDFKLSALKSALFSSLAKLKNTLKNWAVQKIGNLRQKISHLKQMALVPIHAFKERVKTYVQTIKLKIQRFMRPIRRFFHRRALRIRLFIGWIRVVARHSLKTLLEQRF